MRSTADQLGHDHPGAIGAGSRRLRNFLIGTGCPTLHHTARFHTSRNGWVAPSRQAGGWPSPSEANPQLPKKGGLCMAIKLVVTSEAFR